MELGKKIKQLRYKANLTQEQLAERLSIGAQSVSKWENGVTMPDISLLPLLAETFGVSIDDLFDLTTEQRFNRLENRLDIEDELPQDIYREFEDFLKSQLEDERNKKRATELTAYLYWHRMNAAAQKVRRYAKDAVRLDPGKKGCQWMLNMAEGHYIWDWNLSNHSKAIDFYRELVDADPEIMLPYLYLLDNLIVDHRTEEAEKYLARLSRLKDANPVLIRVYPAYIALARFDEPAADKIMDQLSEEYAENSDYLFEAAQYYARKCDYQKAIEHYELSFEKDTKRPRFIDALDGIANIYEIMGDYRKAAETCDRIIDLQKNEWGLTEEVELKDIERERDRLLAKAK